MFPKKLKQNRWLHKVECPLGLWDNLKAKILKLYFIPNYQVRCESLALVTEKGGIGNGEGWNLGQQ